MQRPNKPTPQDKTTTTMPELSQEAAPDDRRSLSGRNQAPGAPEQPSNPPPLNPGQLPTEQPNQDLPDYTPDEEDGPSYDEESKKRHLAAHLIHNKVKQRREKKPNILVIFSDDVGIGNVSCYNHGMQGFYTSNIDRIAKEGAKFSHAYGQNSCTAGRSAFILGQCPFRVGLTSVGMPGSPDGIPDWAPTLADMLKDQGYRTGQIGKNHLGDMNRHLPTAHGFDYFYGNLYHLNTSEEPFQKEYPKEPEFFEKYGPRGVLECQALDHTPPDVREDPRFGPQGDQLIKDTGQLPIERMVHFDDHELLPRMKKFMKEAAKADEPFFLWACTSRMHVWTHLQEDSEGVTKAGLFGDGMVEHDRLVGDLLKTLDDLKIADDTIVVWTTDNGAEKASWPDGGSTWFHGEKGSCNEGGFRVPLVMRWPGVIDPGTQYHEIFSFEDFVPTLLDAAGNPNIVEEMKNGAVRKHGRRARADERRNERNDTWGRVHLDGHSFVPYFLGETSVPPRETFIYFGQTGKLDAVRWREYKGAFAAIEGDIFGGQRVVTSAPTLTNLYEDPFEVMNKEGQQYMRWYGERLWVFAPLGEVVSNFMKSLTGYQSEFRTSMGASDLNYDTAKIAGMLESLGRRHIMFTDPFS